MSPTNIQNLITDLAEKLKKRRGTINAADFSNNYKLAVDIQNQVSVHCKARQFPNDLMKAKAPNETTQELQYRKDIFEPITRPYWDRALGAVNRIWAEQNYSVTWHDPDVQQYFTQQYPVYASVLTYFKTIVTPYKINDPNAVLMIDVGEIPVTEDEDTGETIVDQSKELSPLCKIYAADNVLYFDRDEYVLVLGEDSSRVLGRADKLEDTGLVFYLLTNTTLYRIYQYGKKTDYLFKITELYEHNLGYLPARRLGGKQVSESQQDDIIYESYFMPAVPNLNKALKLDSTLDISINKMAYPIRSYYEAPCTNPNCKNGQVPVYDPANIDAMQDMPTAAVLRDCPVCSGRGSTIGFSPLRDYVHTPRAGFNNEQPIPFPGFAYISPDPTILQFNQQKITEDIERAFMFLNIDVSVDSAGAAHTKTATQSKIDREELFSFLLIISEELFSLLQFSINTMLQLRYPNSNKSAVTICQPMTFDIRSLDELTTEIQNAQSNNAPDAVIRELLKEYVVLRFSTAKNLDVILKAAFYCDALITKSDANIALLKAQNLISPLDAVLHVHIFYFLEQKLMEDENYFTRKLVDIQKDMVELAMGKVNELKVG